MLNALALFNYATCVLENSLIKEIVILNMNITRVQIFKRKLLQTTTMIIFNKVQKLLIDRIWVVCDLHCNRTL